MVLQHEVHDHFIHSKHRRHQYHFAFFIGNIRIIIDENGKRNIQCVNENEHSKAQNRTPQKTIKRLN